MLTGLWETMLITYSMPTQKGVTNENQFLLMLVKLRRRYPHFELARMFGVSVFTVQNVFVTWINFCYCQWQEINWWPEHRLQGQGHCEGSEGSEGDVS